MRAKKTRHTLGSVIDAMRKRVPGCGSIEELAQLTHDDLVKRRGTKRRGADEIALLDAFKAAEADAELADVRDATNAQRASEARTFHELAIIADRIERWSGRTEGTDVLRRVARAIEQASRSRSWTSIKKRKPSRPSQGIERSKERLVKAGATWDEARALTSKVGSPRRRRVR